MAKLSWLGQLQRLYTHTWLPMSVLTRLNVEQLRRCYQRCYRNGAS